MLFQLSVGLQHGIERRMPSVKYYFEWEKVHRFKPILLVDELCGVCEQGW